MAGWTLWNDSSLHNCNGLCDGRQVNFTLQNPTPAPVASLLRRAYYAATTFMDHQIGRVLKVLDDSGVADNTIVVLHGDHGWGLGENNHWHKMTNYEDTARTVLIVAAPFKPNSVGITTSALVELVDLYPTVAALAQSGAPLSKVEGADRSILFDSPQPSNGAAYAFSQYPRCPAGGDPSAPAGWAKNYCKGTKNAGIQWMGLSIRDARWRATVWLAWDGAALKPVWTGDPYAVELYDYAGSDGSDFDSFPVLHANQASNSSLKATLSDLLAALSSHFKNDGNGGGGVDASSNTSSSMAPAAATTTTAAWVEGALRTAASNSNGGGAFAL